MEISKNCPRQDRKFADVINFVADYSGPVRHRETDRVRLPSATVVELK